MQDIKNWIFEGLKKQEKKINIFKNLIFNRMKLTEFTYPSDPKKEQSREPKLYYFCHLYKWG
jgi:hypothetical protein